MLKNYYNKIIILLLFNIKYILYSCGFANLLTKPLRWLNSLDYILIQRGYKLLTNGIRD